ncbi:N-acetylglucosamine-6-phosphate deacetylase [Clostridium coskatii]|uniref:N-acetylglucosamine-6-phosphate deacetylase n=1 Tax=Clostridium coskatii TaxID=1705578 RepID=A0A162NG14_9CLOT|nr:N-acetylglucosamine-6-phosphate deacetylase [Clostridium coskatii]OAA93129.1 N-acetylglucosamine-6-phosphate deacetylase [Clostridium coskatii]OBR90872.1 N-acetylglucosamine-6-phosphate deacetylase [Clostridium coskatii]
MMYEDSKCIINGKIILENEVIENKVLVFREKVVDILDKEIFEKQGLSEKMNEIIDAGGKYVSPGFIDVHIHGSGGKDTMDGEISDLKIISETIAKNGVTAFLPTTMTMKREKIYKAMDAVRLAMKENINGAKVLGIHMEGPFVSEKYRGAQKKDYILKPDFEFIKNYIDIIKIITMAPEEDFEFNFIKKVKNNSDIVLSMGHTNSDYETAKEAVRAGISHATHMFNAMTPLHHRNPGVVGAVLKSNVSFELIADTIHIHPDIFQILLNAKGKDKMILITDSMRAGCMEDGEWELGGQKVIVANNSARLIDGTLAGSILTLNKAVLNILKYTNLKIYEAVALASLNPAKLIKIDDRKGSIKIGKDADLVIFDENLKVSLSVSEGKIIYRK